jgi:hypothetical protein
MQKGNDNCGIRCEYYANVLAAGYDPYGPDNVDYQNTHLVSPVPPPHFPVRKRKTTEGKLLHDNVNRSVFFFPHPQEILAHNGFAERISSFLRIYFSLFRQNMNLMNAEFISERDSRREEKKEEFNVSAFAQKMMVLVLPSRYRMCTSLSENIQKKAGWEEGKGLGRTGDGIVAPIQPAEKFDRTGLGFEKKAFLPLLLLCVSTVFINYSFVCFPLTCSADKRWGGVRFSAADARGGPEPRSPAPPGRRVHLLSASHRSARLFGRPRDREGSPREILYHIIRTKKNGGEGKKE